MLKRSLLVVVALATLLVTFATGAVVGQTRSKALYARSAGYLSSLNAIGAYTASAEASALVRARAMEAAQCKLDISASIYYRELQHCLKDQPCREFVLDAVEKRAPELLGTGELKFRLYEPLERCKS